jgi:hypothetical protein
MPKTKSVILAKILTKENLIRIGLVVFGLTLFPAIVFLIRNMFLNPGTPLLSSYVTFYRSLLDVGVDGMISWSIACVPYFAYDVSLLIKNNRAQKSEPVKK